MIRVVIAAAACLAMATPASGFVAHPSAGLALRSAPFSSAQSSRRVLAGPKMQIEELAGATQDAVQAFHAMGGVEGVTLLAKSGWPEPIVGGVTAYMNLFAPIFKSLNLPGWVLHWFHAINMGLVLGTMGLYGAFLGWKTRLEPATAQSLAPGPSFANLGKTTAELHATLMSVMAVIFFLGANGGLVLTLVQDKPIMESAHFTTAMGGFLLLAMQAALTTRFAGETGNTARTTHAFLGSATMGVFFYHAYLGLQLGLEYSK
mmetsp:Transcript_25006/g.48614  ORF Transcript_25006/g.48614 Transcript_25006/m.48614 type:complete len:261 (+) Transcript_25006:61-843(+)